PFADTLTLLADVCFQIEGRVKDALASGTTILSDRGLLSLLAYQWVRIEKYADSEPFKSYENFRKRVAHILEGFHKPDVHVHLTIDDQTLQRRVEGRGEQPLSDEESRFLLTVKGLIRETQAEFNGIEVEVSQTGLVET